MSLTNPYNKQQWWTFHHVPPLGWDMLQVHTGSAVFSESPALWYQILNQVASQHLQSSDLCASQRRVHLSPALFSFWACPQNIERWVPGKLPSTEALKLSCVRGWNSLQFSKAVLEMWKHWFHRESTRNFPERYWPHIQSPDGVIIWEAAVTFLTSCDFFFSLDWRSFIYWRAASL